MRTSKAVLQLAKFLVIASLCACDDSSGSGSDDDADASSSAQDAGRPDAQSVSDGSSPVDGTTMSDAAPGDAAPADASAPADATTSADAAPAPTCSDYCTKIMANCTSGQAQYPSQASCINACTGFPVGTAADTSGNTLGCRAYHAGAAASNATLHCPHAGPTGDGTCGTLCEGYCSIQEVACTGVNQQYTPSSTCPTKCAMLTAGSGKYNTSFTGGNTNFCRVYHLTVAATSATDANNHCSHIVESSAACN